MVAWDFTCFGISSGTSAKPTKKKKAPIPTNSKASWERYSELQKVAKSRRLEDDSRYIPPDPVNPAIHEQGRRRILYTEEEDRAIIDGLGKFEWGQWREIKLAYPHELRQRDTVSIKDRANTLKKNDCIQHKAYMCGRLF